MKVGEILNKEVEEYPSLRYTLKVLSSFKNNFSSQNRIESSIYINKCHRFISCRKNPSIKSFSFSANKSKKQQQQIYKKIKELQNNNPRTWNEKYIEKNNLYNKLPEIKEKKLFEKHLSCKKRNHLKLLTIPDNEINEKKRNVRRIESGRNLNINNFRNEILPMKSKQSLMSYNDAKKANMQKLFELRVERKFKAIKKITSKLNKPIFLLTNA